MTPSGRGALTMALIILAICTLATGAIVWTEWQSRRAKQDVRVPIGPTP